MTLVACEFLRRYLQHLLPEGFHKVRYFGLWSPANRKMKSVMISTGDNYNLCLFHLIDKPMLSVNTARPATGKLKTEGFRFSCALKRGSPNFLKKR
jgi:hypothetical protein